jgi:heptosyltransferase I
LSKIPKSLCIVRLSALGDVTHMLPIIHTLQRHWPSTKITWVIGKVEHKLLGHLPGVEFIVFQKGNGWREYLNIKRILRDRVFDVLLLMQVSLRANLLGAVISAKRKIGYDKLRAKDLHGLFVNERIPEKSGEHVVDSFFSFLEKIGLQERVRDWKLPSPAGARTLADEVIDGDRPTLIICPCSSHSLRNWNVDAYVAIADYAAVKYNMQVLICGGDSPMEHQLSADICGLCRSTPVNLVGKDTFAQFLELLRSSQVLLSPDSGPAHMAAITQTPVIGLYAASNPCRSGPYNSIQWCVDAYDQASQLVFGLPASQLRWGEKIERPGVMDLITVTQVIDKLDQLMFKMQEI